MASLAPPCRPAEGGVPCREAVTRAYRSMGRSGVPERQAFEAAVQLYRIRHPGLSAPDAGQILAGWLATGGPAAGGPAQA